MERGAFEMFEEYDSILSTAEACEALKVSRTYFYKLIITKKLRAYKEGRTYRIAKSELLDYVNRRTGD